MTTVLRARCIHTMDPAAPVATHVAVRDGRIVAVGDEAAMVRAGAHVLDDRFADAVLLPGFVEGHVHADAGGIWDFVYCGAMPRRDPGNRTWPGVATADGIVARLRADAPQRAQQPVLLGWGYDPLFCDRTLHRHDLDRVSATQPVVVMNASGHIGYFNSEALRRCGLLPTDRQHDGLLRGADGQPTGELRGLDILQPAAGRLGLASALQGADVAALNRFARLCVRGGVTTATDLASLLTPELLGHLQTAAAQPGWPIRIAPAMLAVGARPAEIVARALELRALDTDTLRLGRIKIVLDGSIQGFTARLRAGRYANGAPNGLWYMAPETVSDILERALAAGVQVHVHTNGDQASELLLRLLGAALERHPAPDHRTALQHAQLMDEAQLREARRLGACVNLFANHVYYWGDQHAALTVGPQAAERIDPCATAERVGIVWSMHSDEPVTPMAPLFTAWCAVNRLTRSGRVLGAAERVGVDAALRAVTLGAAMTLKLDDEIDSIAPGKRADFVVLDEDPYRVDPLQLKDVPVRGTVLGGVWHPA